MQSTGDSEKLQSLVRFASLLLCSALSVSVDADFHPCQLSFQQVLIPHLLTGQ